LILGDRVAEGVGQLLLLAGGGIEESGELLVVEWRRGCWRCCGHVVRPPGRTMDRRAVGGLPEPGSGARPGPGAVPRSRGGVGERLPGALIRHPPTACSGFFFQAEDGIRDGSYGSGDWPRYVRGPTMYGRCT